MGSANSTIAYGSSISYSYSGGLLSGVTYPDSTTSSFTYTADATTHCTVVAFDETVRAVMTSKVMTCRRADTVSSLMEKMTEGKFRHLPVVEDGEVIGLVSIGDVVKHRVMEYENEQEALRDYIKTA